MGIFDFLTGRPKGIDNPYENYPVCIVQSNDDRILTPDGRYDLTCFSKSEDSTIREVISAANNNYPPKYRAMGLANESYPIVYKPRYVLFDLIVVAFSDSEAPLDQIAVSFAYIQKGAAYRPLAIEYFEKAIGKVSLRELDKFASVSVLSMLNMIAETYEREHNYKEAMKWYGVLIKKRAGNTDYFKEQIEKLKKVDANWKPLRRRKQSERDIQFEKDVRAAAIAYSQFLRK